MKTKLTKMILSSLAFAGALVCLAAAMAQGTSATARSEAAARNCHVGMLRGLYLATLDGSQSVGGNLVPKAIMEGKRFNGDGTFINDFGTVNIGGFIILNTGGFGGTYTVAPDCTGTISVPDGPSFNMYVGPGAQKFWFTQIAGGAGDGSGVGVGTATRLP
jgi:F0F1-type ATP synthase membrane subunit c/vacuolar-type H+-ATPase subunit K